MSRHLQRSRITKALTDAGLAGSFSEAEARLDAVSPCIVLGEEQIETIAGQAATLTAVITAFKCFGRVSLIVSRPGASLKAPLRVGETLGAAARRLGATVLRAIPANATHVIRIGIGPCIEWRGWTVHCWWDRWLSGVRAEPAELGDSRLGLAGIFAGALAVRQVFDTARLGSARHPRDATLSLWEPWHPDCLGQPGPIRFTAPNALWFVGLGHLGQAFVWNLLWLPYRGERQAVLQDDQRIEVENGPTSILVVDGGVTRRKVPVDGDLNRRKVRVADAWLETAGWSTELIERRHRGDIGLSSDDPPFLLSGLDDLQPRRVLAEAGFDFMVDAGIGHGANDFEGLQVRVIPKGAEIDRLWNPPGAKRPRDDLLESPAYKDLERKDGGCGAYTLANASVAVPFVGAATGAVAIAQLIRLGSMQSGGALIQLSLAAPEMIIDGGRSKAPAIFLGGEPMDLDAMDAQ